MRSFTTARYRFGKINVYVVKILRNEQLFEEARRREPENILLKGLGPTQQGVLLHVGQKQPSYLIKVSLLFPAVFFHR